MTVMTMTSRAGRRVWHAVLGHGRQVPGEPVVFSLTCSTPKAPAMVTQVLEWLHLRGVPALVLMSADMYGGGAQVSTEIRVEHLHRLIAADQSLVDEAAQYAAEADGTAQGARAHIVERLRRGL